MMKTQRDRAWRIIIRECRENGFYRTKTADIPEDIDKNTVRYTARSMEEFGLLSRNSDISEKFYPTDQLF